MAAAALAGDTPITRASSRAAVFFAGGVTRDAASLRVCARQRPGVVADVRLVPARRTVAGLAPSGLHLSGELIPVGVLVAVGAPSRLDREVEAGALRAVAAAARHGQVTPVEGKGRVGVLLDAEGGGAEPMRVVATRAVGIRKAAPARVRIFVAAPTPFEFETAVALLPGKLGPVASLTVHLRVLTHEGEGRPVVDP